MSHDDLMEMTGDLGDQFQWHGPDWGGLRHSWGGGGEAAQIASMDTFFF